MNQNCIEVISKEFCGDYEDSLYKYKTGPQLIEFFNSNFGFEDNYYRGFPTRWVYASSRIMDIQSKNLMNDFFSLIMSIEYQILEKNITPVEAVPVIEKIKEQWNKRLRPFNFKLIKFNNAYELVNINEDLELIGIGGFAEVYKQKSTGLVLKQLKRDSLVDEGSKHRFKREYELTKSLSKIPGVIEVFDFNQSEYYYTMEKCDRTLFDFLNEVPLSLKSKEYVIIEILQIMARVHQMNIIHRDISSNNIFLKGSQIRIADFGLGKDFDFVFSHQTKSTAQLGQIQYCPPEQLMKLSDTGKFSDVYSLGRLINFIMTNNPNDKNHRYKLLVEKATSIDPSNRYIDAQIMYENFKKIKEYTESKEQLEIVTNMIREEKFDHRVAYYISSLNSLDLCQNIINMPGFQHALYLYFESNKESILEILNYIEKDMYDVSNSFEDADSFANIANHVLKNNLGTYVVREKAAEILNRIAYDVNRFYAQRLIRSLIEQGIEPMLEDILLRR